MRINALWLARASICVSLVLLIGASSGEAQKKRSTAQRLQDLEQALKRSQQRQLDLEARIATLERLNLSPQPDALRAGYYQASKDAMTMAIVNIASNSYQYKIRPTTMGGGGGNFTGYKIPWRMALNDNDSIVCAVFRDSVVIKGFWRRGTGTAQCTVNDTGRTANWMYTGDFR